LNVASVTEHNAAFNNKTFFAQFIYKQTAMVSCGILQNGRGNWQNLLPKKCGPWS